MTTDQQTPAPKLKPVTAYTGKPFTKPGHMHGARVHVPRDTPVELAYCISCNAMTARFISVCSDFLVLEDRQAQRDAKGELAAFTFARHCNSKCYSAGRWDEQTLMVQLDTNPL